MERQSLLAHCEWVELKAPLPLDSAQPACRHAFFPVDSTISVLAPDSEKRGVEIGAIGNEGLFGPGAVPEAGSCELRGLVQGSGHAWRIDAGSLRHLSARHDALGDVLARYLRVMLVQTARSVACCRFHSLEQRLARWLLAHSDRSWSPDVAVTHDMLAMMLGARRAGVTVAAGVLEERGLVGARRGQITVLDREGLLRAACSCYLRDRQTYEEGMGVPPSRRRY